MLDTHLCPLGHCKIWHLDFQITHLPIYSITKSSFSLAQHLLLERVMAQPIAIPDINSHRATVLCVDDSPEMLFICKRFLEARGYDVLTASNGEAALETLKEHPVDAAITDNEMPGMTGLQLAQEIKHVQGNLPVLMFSLVRPDFSPSVDCFLEKSYGPLALVNALQDMVPACSFSK